jgi:hypothetical protein
VGGVAVRESTIEAYLVRQVKMQGGKAKKMYDRNDPDRLILLPYMEAFFVETKAPGEKPRPGQLREFDRLRKLGFSVYIADSIEEVNRILEVE